MSATRLDEILVPGYNWFELQAGVDFREDVPLRKVEKLLHRAALRRHGQVSVYFTPEGNVRVYATNCRY